MCPVTVFKRNLAVAQMETTEMFYDIFRQTASCGDIHLFTAEKHYTYQRVDYAHICY